MPGTNPKRARFVHFFIVYSLFQALVFSVPSTALFAEGSDTGEPDPIALALEAEEQYEKIKDYTSIFLKEERIDGELLPVETMALKFRKPFDFYMKWIKKPFKNREMIFRKGKNKGKLIVHEGGFLGLVTVSLSPTGSTAMKGNHHPVFDAGIGSSINLVVRGLNAGLERKEVTVNYNGMTELDGRKTMVLEGIFPRDIDGHEHTVKKGEDLWQIAAQYNQDMYVILYNNKDVDDPYDVSVGQKILVPYYYCQRIEVFIDEEWRIPTKISVFDWQGNLYEQYQHKQLKLNVGLTDRDFDPENPDYDF